MQRPRQLGAAPQEPAEEVTSDLLGIVNEALSNIARHSTATRVWVEVSGDGGGLTMIIRDNGRGFDAAAGAALGHHGLRNMRSRAADIGAIMEITSTGQLGTEIRVRLEPDSTAPEGAE